MLVLDSLMIIWGLPKIRGTFLGVPIRRTIVYWGLYWGPPSLGNYHLSPYILPTDLSRQEMTTDIEEQDEQLDQVRVCLGFRV